MSNTIECSAEQYDMLLELTKKSLDNNDCSELNTALTDIIDSHIINRIKAVAAELNIPFKAE